MPDDFITSLFEQVMPFDPQNIEAQNNLKQIDDLRPKDIFDLGIIIFQAVTGEDTIDYQGM